MADLSDPYGQPRFAPRYGRAPYLLVDRGTILRDAAADFAEGAEPRNVVFTGARGMGKTVALGEYADIAQQNGWLLLRTRSAEHLSELATTDLPLLLQEHGERPTRSRLTSVGISRLGLSGGRSVTERYAEEASLASRLAELAQSRAQAGTGVLLTVDEVHRADPGELRHVCDVVDGLQRDGLPVSFAAAGLSGAVSPRLTSGASTILQRADRYELGAVSDEGVAAGLQRTAADLGKPFDANALREATARVQGLPILMQAQGDEAFRAARGATISVHDVARGFGPALDHVRRQTHQIALADLGEDDRALAGALAGAGGRIDGLSERLAMAPGDLGERLNRLQDADLIRMRDGRAAFVLPYMREHLQQGRGSLPTGTSRGLQASFPQALAAGSVPQAQTRPRALPQRSGRGGRGD